MTRDRSTYLGSHDTVAILGLHPYKTPVDVWIEKTRGHVDEDKDIFVRGRVIEPGLITHLAQLDGRAIIERNIHIEREDFPFLGATVDAIADRHIYEVTTCSTSSLDAWGEDGDEHGAAIYKWAQTQHHLALDDGRRADTAEIALFVADTGKIRRYPVVPDISFQSRLLDAAERFWVDHVITGLAPDVDEEAILADAKRANDMLSRLFDTATDTVLEVDDSLEALARAYAEAKDHVDAAEANKDAISAGIKAALREAKGAKGRGVSISWAQHKGKSETDHAALAGELARKFSMSDEDFAALKASFTHQRPGYRVLRVTAKKEAK
jgi:predicted phage-related endonuclease